MYPGPFLARDERGTGILIKKGSDQSFRAKEGGKTHQRTNWERLKVFEG